MQGEFLTRVRVRVPVIGSTGGVVGGVALARSGVDTSLGGRDERGLTASASEVSGLGQLLRRTVTE